MFRRIDAKPLFEIASEWDALAELRHRQISSGTDITYQHLLVPTILSLARATKVASVLDAGCGVGVLTHALAERFGKVTGIDPSAKCIEIAQRHYSANVTFIRATLEDYSKERAGTFDLVVANMVFMDIIDLEPFLEAVRRVLRPSGKLVFSMTHPWFWPSYYGYESEPWFHYDEELIIEGPFKISTQPGCVLQSTHVHRPLERYINDFRNIGLSLETLREPMPPPEIHSRYPARWEYPRYLFGVCVRSS